MATSLAALVSPVNGMFVRILPENVDSAAIVFASFVLFVVPAVLSIGTGSTWAAKGSARLILVRGIGCLLSIIVTVVALRRIDFATIYFLNMSGPLVASLGAVGLLHEPIRKAHFVGALLTLLGASLALSPQLLGSAEDLLISVAVVGSSTLLSLTARTVGKSLNPINFTVISMGFAAILSAPFAAQSLKFEEPTTYALLLGISLSNFAAIMLSSFAYHRATFRPMRLLNC
ncbi:EamA family transporter [Mesorhizobium sp. USDA 4775]